MSKTYAFLLTCLLVFCGLFSYPAYAQNSDRESLSIVTQAGSYPFQIEVMRSEEQQQRGMMFRRSLGESEGMLFPFSAPRIATFWMQNTYVSLDLIFIRQDGTIHRIEKAAEPLSTATISSGAPVLAVLEVLAGTADRLGMKSGDKVVYPLFSDK